MTIKDIVEYVMYTRGNTNRAVLTSMLRVLVDEGGDEGPVYYDGGDVEGYDPENKN